MSEQVGSQVYIKDKNSIWIPATLDKTVGGKAHVTVPIYPNEHVMMSDGGRKALPKHKWEQRVIDLKDYDHKILPLQNVDNSGNLIEYPDMVELPYLHEAAIMYNMKKRHIDGKPYTRTGDIIIAINPFQWFHELYTDEKRVLYSNKLVWNAKASGSAERDARTQLEPHVYEISALSYKGLAFDNEHQSILVSGESGAGKTETVKIAMNHIAQVQRGPSLPGKSSYSSTNGLDPVVQRVVDSNPLLEAFGNAQTRRNDNSSRFGKYLQLQFDKSEAALMSYEKGGLKESKCKLAGSKCDVYLLEKNRVTDHDYDKERTFHIFYQILAAPENEKTQIWDGLRSTTNNSFKYVGNTKTTSIEGMTDAQHYAHTVKTLELIGIKGNKLRELMRSICAVMQCGNLSFGPVAGDNDKSQITSGKELIALAHLMGVSEQDLTLAFTERTMKTRSETYKVPLKTEFAKDACDALARELYGNIFLWLVREINAATCAELNYTKAKNIENFGIIGLLDIFGFESFIVNRFEQLCINYANEKLQQKFTEDIFRSVQKEYEEEGIALAEIHYDDNTDVLDLIEGRTGLLAMLNEECVRPKGNDFDFVQKALAQNSKSPCLLVNKTSRESFGVHHYAGKVMYEAAGFVTSNQDTLPTDLYDLCAKSTNDIISHKVEEEIELGDTNSKRGGPTASPKRQKSNIVAPTVWSKYKVQLHSLMLNLRKTSSRYIRCIKPNMDKKPVLMEHQSTVEQLRCAGVVAAVTLSRSAFPNRVNNSVVRFRFASQWDDKKYPSKGSNRMTHDEKLRADCEAILTCALKSKAEIDDKGRVKQAFVVGKTRCYFRAGALEYLEANRLENGLDEPATKIQALARGYISRGGLGKRKAEAEQMKRKKEEEERLRREEAIRKVAEEKRRKEEAERKAREAKEAKERAEAEERARKEQLAREKREREEQEAREREEAAEEEKESKLQQKIDKLRKELEKKQIENKNRIKAAQDKLRQLEEQKNVCEAKNEALLQSLPQEDVEKNQKKIEESEKLIAYLRKENNKAKEAIENTKNDLSERQDENHRLCEANVAGAASLDNLEKQNANFAANNEKLEASLAKWKKQNKQLKADLANRLAYFKAETKIRAEYEKAMEKIVEILQNKSSDKNLIQEVLATQAQVEQFMETNSNPALTGSDVSDF